MTVEVAPCLVRDWNASNPASLDPGQQAHCKARCNAYHNTTELAAATLPVGDANTGPRAAADGDGDGADAAAAGAARDAAAGAAEAPGGSGDDDANGAGAGPQSLAQRLSDKIAVLGKPKQQPLQGDGQQQEQHVLEVIERPPDGDDGPEPEPATMDTLTDRERAKLKRLESFITFMDSGFRVPLLGYKFGMDAVMGVVPYAGDAAGALVGTYIMSKALRYNLPKRLVCRMALNQAIDACAGVVPFVGDVFDVGFKANRRNLLLLQAHLQKPRQAKRADGCFLFGVFFTVVVLPLLAVVAVIVAIICIILAAFGKIG